MLGLEGKLGVVAQGAHADLIVLDANPLDDITVLDRPEVYLRTVIKAGRIVAGSLA
jgi:imidazolonepropionase-like amidohydrolase